MRGYFYGREMNVYRIGYVPRVTARHDDRDRQEPV